MQLDPVLTEQLYAGFPRLYRARHKSPQESSMCWGFDCGDGWYELLHDLSAQLSSYLSEHPGLDLEAVQVKSKFGFLRFRINKHDAVAEAMIGAACQRASITCEITGKPGHLCRGLGREPVMVLCPEKAAELGYSAIDQ